MFQFVHGASCPEQVVHKLWVMFVVQAQTILSRSTAVFESCLVCDIVHSLSGVLLRKLEVGLVGVSHVIVDEVHERDINVSVCVTTYQFFWWCVCLTAQCTISNGCLVTGLY